MEHDEGALMQRFDRAVSDLTPEVTTLVDAGQRRGEAMRRRRRIASGAGVVMVAAVTVGAVAFGQGVFDHESAGPTNPDPTGVQQLEPATPRGLAAALVDVLDAGDPTLTSGDMLTDDRSGREMQAGAAYQIEGAPVEVELYVGNTSSGGVEVTCAEARTSATTWCDDTALADGTPVIRVVTASRLPDRGTAAVSAGVVVWRNGVAVSAIEILPDDAAGPAYTEENLPISIDRLLKLASDPRIGLQTTAAYNESGEGLEDFRENLDTSTGSGSASGSSQHYSEESTTGSN
jgi:hypothetical protein